MTNTTTSKVVEKEDINGALAKADILLTSSMDARLKEREKNINADLSRV